MLPTSTANVTLVIPCKGADCNDVERIPAGLEFPVMIIRNRPYGAAIKEAIRQAQTPWLLTMDADGQHRPEDVKGLWMEWRCHRADMLIGYRWHRRTTLRTSYSMLLNLTASILVGAHIPDFGSGLRIFRRDIALEELDRLPDGFDFNAVLTMRFIIGGWQVSWSPIPDRPRQHGRSHVRFRDGICTLGSILRAAK